MNHYGLPFDGIPFDRDARGQIIIHLVKGPHPAAEYAKNDKSADDIYNEVKRVLLVSGIHPETSHVVVFTRLGWHEGNKTWHTSPYAGRGNSQNGFCWQCDQDILDARLLQETNQWLDDGEYGHISVGRYNTIFIGGAAHELGHLFGLPHDAAEPVEFKARGYAIMGEGNRHYRENLRGEGKGAFIDLAEALDMVANPLFSHVNKGLETPWHGSVTNCGFESAPGHLRITGRFLSDKPVYGVVAYLDPDGHIASDRGYSAASYVANLGPGNTFSFDITSLPAGKSGEMRISLLCASGQHLDNGKKYQAHFAYMVGADGRLALAKRALRFVRADSEETATANRGANAVDGDENTFWHTQWHDASPPCPHEIVIELTPPSVIKGLTYLPRQDGDVNGTVKDYEIYVSNDGIDFSRLVAKGEFDDGMGLKKVLIAPQTCHFIKFKALSEINGGPWTSAAEVGVIAQ